MTGEILRTFIAIELEEPLRIAITRVQGKFKRAAPPGGVKSPDDLPVVRQFIPNASGALPCARLICSQ